MLSCSGSSFSPRPYSLDNGVQTVKSQLCITLTERHGDMKSRSFSCYFSMAAKRASAVSLALPLAV